MATVRREVPEEAIELIKSFEGIPDGDPGTVHLDPYLDPLDIWRIGWGHGVVSAGVVLRGAGNRMLARALFPGGITLEQAGTLLRADLVTRAADVLRLVKVPLSDNQFGAVMSFVFNCGAAHLGGSTLLKLLNAGNGAGAADQFLAWNKGRRNGLLVELPGLTRRRRAERALFLGQDWRAVAATPLARSRGQPAGRVPPREVPEAPTAAEAAAARRIIAAATAPGRKATVAKKTRSAAATPRGRTTTARARPPARRAPLPGPRTAR